LVRVDLAEVRRGLGLPAAEDRAGWERIRSLLRESVGESTFAIWIEPLELIAIDRNGTLVISAPAATASWLRDRFGRVIAGCADRAGHQLRLADEPERWALGRNDRHAGALSAAEGEINQTEVS
jgi:DnaA N-terminal domain